MKNKKEIISSINIVISEINKILSNDKYLNPDISDEARKSDKIKAFTLYCPFREYNDLLKATLTFPYGSRKYSKKYLTLRVTFWLKLEQIISEYDFREKDIIKDILKYTIREADTLTFNQ